MKGPIHFPVQAPQAGDEALAVFQIQENGGSFNASDNDVMNGPGLIYAGFPWPGCGIAQGGVMSTFQERIDQVNISP